MRAAAVIIQDNKALLIHRIKPSKYREKLGQPGNYYVLPGGRVEKGETPEEAVIREIKEELTVDILIDKKLWQIENLGAQEFYFLVKKVKGTPKLAGEYDERLNDGTSAKIALVSKDKLESTNLLPEIIKDKLLSYMTKRYGE